MERAQQRRGHEEGADLVHPQHERGRARRRPQRRDGGGRGDAHHCAARLEHDARVVERALKQARITLPCGRGALPPATVLEHVVVVTAGAPLAQRAAQPRRWQHHQRRSRQSRGVERREHCCHKGAEPGQRHGEGREVPNHAWRTQRRLRRARLECRVPIREHRPVTHLRPHRAEQRTRAANEQVASARKKPHAPSVRCRAGGKDTLREHLLRQRPEQAEHRAVDPLAETTDRVAGGFQAAPEHRLRRAVVASRRAAAKQGANRRVGRRDGDDERERDDHDHHLHHVGCGDGRDTADERVHERGTCRHQYSKCGVNVEKDRHARTDADEDGGRPDDHRHDQRNSERSAARRPKPLLKRVDDAEVVARTQLRRDHEAPEREAQRPTERADGPDDPFGRHDLRGADQHAGRSVARHERARTHADAERSIRE
mmetsp:Transcript_20955/g.54027  ORF Transcript_20955/g.54027 Transcript_20955/m.54027 type:complete len:429 (+) Transcript_20955:1923-3209(+)